MDVNFGGIVPLSTVDWRGRSAVVVFFNGCPFRCPYCHNFENITQVNRAGVGDVWEKISGSLGFVSALVFLGGEPAAQPDALAELAGRAKKSGLMVGLHSNGFFPGAIESLIEQSLVDKFFIDVKAPLTPDAYSKAAGLGRTPVRPDRAVNQLRRSLELIDASPAELEIRTTVFPGFIGTDGEIRQIAAGVKALLKNPGKASYVVQQGIGRHSEDAVLRKTLPFSRDGMIRLGSAAASVFAHTLPVFIRTEEGGQERIDPQTP